jgi:cytochrome c-type biogenesis protein
VKSIHPLLNNTGQAISYPGLAFVLFLGADLLKLSGFFQKYGEMIIGTLLLLIGLLMLGVVKVNFPGLSGLTSNFTGNVLASALGIVTPFCSCSAIPLFLWFVEAGITHRGYLLLSDRIAHDQ